MAKIKEREKAVKLRREGESIRSIAQQLDISKSTASYWCRDVILSPDQIQALQEKMRTAGARALFQAAQKKRMRRRETENDQRKKGYKKVGEINKRDLFILGLGLYWGEGYKESSGELGFTNSDPEMIQIYMEWLKRIFEVDTTRLVARITINNRHSERIEKITEYWSEITEIPIDQFTKPSLINTRSKKKFENSENYFGTLRIKVRSGTKLKQEILGSLQACGYKIK